MKGSSAREKQPREALLQRSETGYVLVIPRGPFRTRGMPHVRSVERHLGLPGQEVWALREYFRFAVDELNALLRLPDET